MKWACLYLQDGDIKGSTTKIVHHNDLAILGRVQAIGKCGCSGLVNDTLHTQASNAASILFYKAIAVSECVCACIQWHALALSRWCSTLVAWRCESLK